MKLLSLVALAAVASAAAVSPVETSSPTITQGPHLEKRYQKVRLPTTTSSTSSETPKPWIRTIYSTVREIVTPTVIRGVTFSAKPPENTDDPLPWVSLNKFGSPVTVKPKIKNGRTEKASPDYSTYFKTATTHVYNYEELQAHNMAPDQVHEEIEFIDEDKTYVSLNPLIRCTPNRYTKQGLARDRDTAPFCTPHSGVELVMGKTYFITWYTKYFPSDVQKVRLHFTYVKESAISKGMKRDIDRAFHTTEWIDNLHGFYAFEIDEEWFNGKPIVQVGMTIQPDNVDDDDFDLFENATVFKLALGNKVARKTKEQKALEDQGITSDSWYYVAMSIPLAVTVSGLLMYVFIQLTKKDRDFTETRYRAWKAQHKVLGKFRPSKKNKKYSELPTMKDDLKNA